MMWRNAIVGGVAVITALTVMAGTSYALFSSQATLTNLQVTTGNAGLLVGTASDDLHAGTFSPTFDWTNLYPGYTTTTTFYLKNASSSPINLAVKGQLTGTTGDWDALKSVVTMRVMKQGSSSSTGYKTLADWSTDPGISLPGGDLTPGQVQTYTLDLQVPTKYADGTLIGNEISGKSLTNLALVFSGTQD